MCERGGPLRLGGVRREPLVQIPVLALGPGTQDLAHTLIHRLTLALALGCVPVFTSDGLNLYFYALTAHFGCWCARLGQCALQCIVAAGPLYGQVKKCYRHRRVVRVEYRMLCGRLDELKARLQALGLSGRLNTAFVERLNLTLRQAIPPHPPYLGHRADPSRS